MKIKSIGEKKLIENIKKKIKIYSNDVVKGAGDDAAVLKHDKKNYMIFTGDILVENVHFSLKHSTPEQVGMKAIEQNVSDIAAMGGIPKFALVSLALPKSAERSFIDGLYKGINKKSKKYKISIVGGNISGSKEIVVNISMTGLVGKKYLALRSGAKIGDLIFCSGHAGASAAGLELLKQNKKGKSIKKHLEPESRLDLARKLAKIGINSMIDASDGIASEIKHICNESKVGAIVYYDKIPVSKNTIKDSKKIKKNPIDFALYGGEDFELIFTAPKNRLQKLKKYGTAIGEIVSKKHGINIIKNKKASKLGNGFEHFK